MPSQSSPTVPEPPALVNGRISAHTQDVISNAVRDDSVSQLAPALDLVRSVTHPPFTVKITQLMYSAVEHQSHAVLRYLLQIEGAQLSKLSSSRISEFASIALFEILLSHGWHVNKSDENDGMRLIDWSCGDEELVKWLVGNGATVDNGEEKDIENEMPRPPPLLETCARFGSLSTFQFLQDKGAKLGKRTLHRAAGAGAFVGADPDNLLSQEGCGVVEDENESTRQARKNAEDVLKFLIEKLQLDVNSMDADVPKGLSYCGTPLNYAAREKRGAGVVRWLLDRGADPSIRSLGADANGEGHLDARGYAEWQGCTKVLEALNTWRQDR